MSLLSALVGLFVVSFDSVIITLFVSARADFVGAVLPDLSFRHRFVSRNAVRPPNCAQALERDRNNTHTHTHKHEKNKQKDTLMVNLVGAV